MQNIILTRYPDIIPEDSSVNNCNKTMTCKDELNSFQNLNDGLFHYLNYNAHGIGGGWVTEVTSQEIADAKCLMAEIRRMQNTVENYISVVNWNMPDHDMCQSLDNNIVQNPNDSYKEAYYFCDRISYSECPNYSKECNNINFINWHPYKQIRSNRGVYLANESILMLRRWDRNNKNDEKENEALSGIMHPTIYAHAIAADSVYDKLKTIINR